MLNFRNLIQKHLEVIYMNQSFGGKNKRLTDYLMELQALRGIVPICANCKSIRDSQDKGHPVEHYLIKNPEAEFSHGFWMAPFLLAGCGLFFSRYIDHFS